MGALELVRIICIKMGKLEKLPKWRFITRKNISIKIIKLYNQFLKCNIYERASVLASILIQLNTNTPYLISSELDDMVKIDQISITIPFMDDKYTGNVIYTPKISEFDVHVAQVSIPNTEESFNVSDNVSISSHNRETFKYICNNILNDKFFIIISNISYAVNYYSFNANQID